MQNLLKIATKNVANHTFIGCASALLGSLVLMAPSPAQACGGTFCDNSVIPMPVDQRGEDILFVQDGPEIEVHVRIQYTGEAERFAWLVPLQALPEISVGSESLFRILANETAPTWRRSLEYECPDEDPWQSGMGFVPMTDSAALSEDPDIVLTQTVGAFDIVVLQGGTADEVIEFLDANDYAQDPQATPIIQSYLDEGFLLAAVKLTAGAETEEIHPLVFRMLGDEPCVPLRLTSIAAEDDMGVRAYFLGQERWGPLNYKHVVLNPLGFRWSEADGTSAGRELYLQQLSAAADVAGGRAFATDYAGAVPDIPSWYLVEPSWDETAFVGVDPITAIDLIANQLLNQHPLIQPLLMQFIPPPDGLEPQEFWNNIEQYADQIDLSAWDSVAFAAALAERIIEPGLHAAELIETWPYLTRLHTTISPHEMTVDPIFTPVAELGDVPNVLTVGGLDLCGDSAGAIYSVPWEDHHRSVCVYEDGAWPLVLTENPALRIEQLAPMGPPQVDEDFSQVILAGWGQHQAQQSCWGPDKEEDGGESSGGGETVGQESDGDTGVGVSDDGATATCACSTQRTTPPIAVALGLLMLGLIGPWRRRD